ncbi:MAG: PAC2 family protein [Actinobacteria bacterium]|nr:PAC2 family protein [Actinomycetota bacterium]
MEHVRWARRPDLRSPVLVAAFEGWNDAGDAASGTVRWLRRHWSTEPIATIDPEEFFDFTTQRPRVRLSEGRHREVVWPEWEITAGRVPGTGVDAILLLGYEPALRWRTFCDQVVGVASALGARLAVTVGALLAEVSHTRRVDVIGTSDDAGVVERLALVPSTYEGPTGITGVLHAALRDAGIPSASLWAAVPGYAPTIPSPKATLALVERTCSLLDVPAITTDLEIASAAYERQMAELVEADEDMAEYVRRIEEQAEADPPSVRGPIDPDDARDFVADVERFLREQRPDE